MGLPSISDRIAQTVVKMYLEPQLDPSFHSDSYGYRLGKSAIQAIAVIRERCWKYGWRRRCNYRTERYKNAGKAHRKEVL